jgi:hypothetical protein
MRHLLAAAAFAGICASFTASVVAAPSAGSAYAGPIADSLNSKTAYVGEPVTLTHVSSPGAGINGATMYGTVTHVVHAGQGRTAQLQMTFTRLTLRSGASYAINGIVTGMQAGTKSNALKEAGGAVVGMIVGNIVGKSIFHMSGGGLAGAAGGFLIAKNNREDMTIPAGSAVRVVLRSVRRQARH